MLIPSTGLLEILHGAEMGIWTERLFDGSIALVAKLPQTIIKRIYRGVECKLVTDVMKVEKYSILYLGFIVCDDADNPLVLIQPVGIEKALTEYQQMFTTSSVKLHIFDEFCHPLLGADCNFDPTMAVNVFEKIMSASPQVLESVASDTDSINDFGHAVVKGVDMFQGDLEAIKIGRSTISVPDTNCLIPLSLIVHDPPNGFSVDDKGNTVEFTLTQKDEGAVFEELISFTLRDFHLQHAYLRPIIIVEKKERELADFMALNHSDNTIILIQAKATASLIDRLDKSGAKRSSSIEKKVKASLKQLEGAIKQIRSGNQIYDCNHNKIKIPEYSHALIHGISIVSELYPSVDWKKIEKDVNLLSDNKKYRTLFHIVDLQELQQLVKNSSSAKEFHNYLVGRWLKVKMSGTAYVRSRTRQPWDNEN